MQKDTKAVLKQIGGGFALYAMTNRSFNVTSKLASDITSSIAPAIEDYVEDEFVLGVSVAAVAAGAEIGADFIAFLAVPAIVYESGNIDQNLINEAVDGGFELYDSIKKNIKILASTK